MTAAEFAPLRGDMLDRMAPAERYNAWLLERALPFGLLPEAARLVNRVGALGWLVTGRLLRRSDVPLVPLRLFDRLIPLLRPLDGVLLPFGLSLWAVARRA